MIYLREQYWAMPVPEDAWVWDKGNFKTDFVINMGYLIYPKAGKKKWLSLPDAPGLRLPGLDYNERIKACLKMPAGDWEIICGSMVVTREQAANIVEWLQIADKTGYRDYSFIDDLRLPFVDPLTSLQTLFISKGCDTNKAWLILKKEE